MNPCLFGWGVSNLWVVPSPTVATYLYIMYTSLMNKLPLQVSMTEFRDNLVAYLDLVARGKTVTITRRGKPSAELKTVEAAPAVDVAELEAFRASLGVRVEEGIVVRARREERY